MIAKITAVEWLVNELKDSIGLKDLHTIEKAKEIEKQNIIEAFEIGYENGACTNENESVYHGSNYYNKTFKSK